nr:aminoglycoside phosphotransferase family protein [Pyxidicoccus fallax]
MVEGLASDWRLVLGRVLKGGTDALVIEATLADGRAAVLKVAGPTREPISRELDALLVARGRGYAEVYHHDRERRVMLLERLGAPLATLGWSADAELTAICATLNEAWAQASPDAGFATGAEKAESLATFTQECWEELGRPCSERLVARAHAFAEARRQAFTPDTAVLGHGDAHDWNTLQVPGAGADRFKFIDPDGFFIEKAYDLGVLMREWTHELLAGDPVALGRARRDRLAALTGAEPEAIWQWGLMECTSSGLLCLKLGLEGARELLAVGEAWAMAD